MGSSPAEERIASIRKAMAEGSNSRSTPPPRLFSETVFAERGVVVQGDKNVLSLVIPTDFRPMVISKRNADGFEGVNWKQAPRAARWWAIDADGQGHWFCEPNVAAFTDFWLSEPIVAPSFGYVGDYRDSLVERPRGE